ncbi:MAG: diacylglycerol/lipid kinase family protein [Planctomycetaceae bacterium]
MSKRLLVWNGGSGKASAIDELHELLGSETTAAEITAGVDLTRLVVDSVRGGCETLIAAGGDGTVNAVVNAVMAMDEADRPKVGIIPLGTANDFAGTLAIPAELAEAVAVIDSPHLVPIDVVQITSGHVNRYYANMAAGGNSVRVSEELTDEIKATWGAFCYIRGAVGVLADMQSFHIKADCDGEEIELDSWAVLVANGKTNAGRILVAPLASPADGLLDIILIRDGTVLDMIEIVSKTLLSSFLESEQVIFRQAKRLKLHSVPGMRFTIDGEVIDEEPIQFDVVPHAIRMFVGPEFYEQHEQQRAVDQHAVSPLGQGST